jgi:hypothetical protein
MPFGGLMGRTNKSKDIKLIEFLINRDKKWWSSIRVVMEELKVSKLEASSIIKRLEDANKIVIEYRKNNLYVRLPKDAVEVAHILLSKETQ